MSSAAHSLDTKTKWGTISGMWEMDEEERRISIALRASKGARKTLNRRDVVQVSSAVLPEPSKHFPSPIPTLSPSAPRWRHVLFEVALKHSISPRDILGQFRDRNIVVARHEVFHRLRDELQFSLARIGKLIGGRDHTTVRSGIAAHLRREAAK